jgi:drug/metabolite transporter (DMT)-like permease
MHFFHDHWRGAAAALWAAALFGASTPLSKILLRSTSAVWLPGLLYLGSGLGLFLVMLLCRRLTDASAREANLERKDLPWLGGAILSGGVIAPVLLVLGLRGTAASAASLMLNLEGVFTALLAWFAFRENFDRRILFGMALIVAGGVLLSWKGSPVGRFPWSSLAIAGACLAWALDNNLTRKVSASNPMQIAMWKGLVAGSINTALAWFLTHASPSAGHIALAGLLGFLSYGVSLTLFVLALRQLGSARTGAYFSAAPFVGVLLSFVLLAETPSPSFWLAATLMIVGIWLHLTEHHKHGHVHEPLEHEHRHTHDEHHQHHPGERPAAEAHSHRHLHSRLAHAHPHVPDIHHRHEHL